MKKFSLYFFVLSVSGFAITTVSATTNHGKEEIGGEKPLTFTQWNLQAAPKPENINDLPEEVLMTILNNLSPQELRSSRLVCKQWARLGVDLLLRDESADIDFDQFANQAPLAPVKNLLTDPQYQSLHKMVKVALLNFLTGEGQETLSILLPGLPEHCIDDQLAATKNSNVGARMAFLKLMRDSNRSEEATKECNAIRDNAMQKGFVWALESRWWDDEAPFAQAHLLEEVFKTYTSNTPEVNEWLGHKIFQYLKSLPEGIWQKQKSRLSVMSNGRIAASKPFAQFLGANAALSQLSEGDLLKWSIEYAGSWSAFKTLRACNVGGLQWKKFLKGLVREKGHVFAASCLLAEGVAAHGKSSLHKWISNGLKSDVQALDSQEELVALDALIQDCLSSQTKSQKIFGKRATKKENWSKLCQTLTNLRVKNFFRVLSRTSDPSHNPLLSDVTFLIQQLEEGESFAVQELAKFLAMQFLLATADLEKPDFDWYFDILRKAKN